jgi:exonuclease III
MAAANVMMLNWNIHGLNAPVKCCVVQDMVSATKATVVCIQETNLQFIDERLVMETLGQRFKTSFSFLPDAGTCGGILIAVAEDHFQLVSSSQTQNTLSVRIKMLNDGVEWCECTGHKQIWKKRISWTSSNLCNLPCKGSR